MRWRSHLYPAAIEQNLDAARLSELSETAAVEADESGYLAGNQMYQDLRGYDWLDVARTLEVERRLIAQLQGSADLEAEAARIDDERLDCFEPSEGLWGLDIGVASATIALSALGAIPVGSCNAGGFGGHHQGAYPLYGYHTSAPRGARSERLWSRPLMFRGGRWSDASELSSRSSDVD